MEKERSKTMLILGFFLSFADGSRLSPSRPDASSAACSRCVCVLVFVRGRGRERERKGGRERGRERGKEREREDIDIND